MIFLKQFLLLKKLSKITNLVFLVFFLLFSFNLNAQVSYIIQGNQNIDKKTILSLIPNNFSLSSSEKINEYQKKLYETGFFEKINFKIIENQLYINIVENPLVNFLYIDGIIMPDLNKKISKIPNISENSILQFHLIKKDIEKISTYLNSLGYLNNEVNYQLIKINNNKVNLFYNIKLNKKFRINRIFFIGNKYFKSSTLLDILHSAEYGWWKFLSTKSIPSEGGINYDISKIKSFYLDNGFFDVQINSHSIKILNDEKVNLIYSINSGEKYKVRKVSLIDSSQSLSQDNLKEINKYFKKIDGQLLNISKIKRSITLVEKYLRKSNFDLLISYKLTNKETKNIDLVYNIFDYPNKKIIEKIIISGNSITDERVIRNNLSISDGDFLNNSKIITSIDRLKGIGLFSNAKYEINDLDDTKSEIIISVIEKPTGEIAAGAGAGTNGATISGSLNENNFLGKGIRLKSSLNLGTEKILGNINYSDPDYKSSGNNLSTSFFVQSTDYKNASYTNKIIGLNATTTYEPYDTIFLTPGFGIDYDILTANNDSSTIIKKREGNFYTTKFFYNASKNTKNREFQATDGYLVGLGQGFSILSDIPYISNSIFGSYYNEYKKGFVGSLKSKIETIGSVTSDDIKFSDRLFVSSNNLRGFSHMGIGPKLDGDFIGGNYSYYGSISTTIPNGLPERWNAITNIFLDTANVWGVDDNSTGDTNKIRSSVGLGLSWTSPIGPIAITYAEPVSKYKTDEVEQFNFKIGSAF